MARVKFSVTVNRVKVRIWGRKIACRMENNTDLLTDITIHTFTHVPVTYLLAGIYYLLIKYLTSGEV